MLSQGHRTPIIIPQLRGEGSFGAGPADDDFHGVSGCGLGLRVEQVLDGWTRNQEVVGEPRLSAGRSGTIASPWERGRLSVQQSVSVERLTAEMRT